MIIPPYLKKNDTVGIVCPSGFMDKTKALVCIETLQQWGFRVKIGKTLGHQFNYFSGTDEERIADIQSMINDEDVSAILCGRGGYGLSRIIDKIDFRPLKKNPKWIVGYSDITLLHCHLNKKMKLASLHAPMAGAFNDGVDNMYIQSLKNVLLGKKTNYKVATHEFNHLGKVEGELVGGNLSMLINSIGTSSEPDVKDKILFIEDVGEYIYTADRMLQQLKRAGWFNRVKGLLVGTFSDMQDTTNPFGQTIYEVIKDVIVEYDFPVAFNFPVGHTQQNFALKCGVEYSLSVTKKSISLKEI
ncbi:LD-carboxypeptidase [Arachidicoccus ginsenosidimutans]|uniref:S66 peptidase family protein n=1 Tax=Arachidicoccus sp. BS20 TaxID=1850526 RepID=UPI0007F10888|nr:LD-carboxypeptidase [Arachidicoccus sp. BS20]ANI89129.1 LD-carboxypeptidase [Arachidicoccus sp. BS20]